MLVVHVDIVAICGSRASEATKKPKGSYCQAWPTPRQVSFCIEKHPPAKVMFSFWQLHWDSYLCRQENHRNGEEIQAHADECSQVHTIFTWSHP